MHTHPMVAHDINIQAMRHAPTEIQNKVGNDRITKITLRTHVYSNKKSPMLYAIQSSLDLYVDNVGRNHSTKHHIMHTHLNSSTAIDAV